VTTDDAPPAGTPSADAPASATRARVSPVPHEARPYQGQRAGIVTRLVAAALDCCVIGIVLSAGYIGIVATIFFLNPRSFSWPSLGVVFSLTMAIIVAIVYLTVFWTLSGRTYGYLVMGLRVLGFGGRRLRFPGALVRAAFVVFVPVGIFWVPLSRRNKSVQDLVLGTRVVYDWEPRRAHREPPADEVSAELS
jgi:uncharacterized RDD family membrane protein YckC